MQQILPILIILAIAVIGFCLYYFNSKQIILRKLSKIKSKNILQFRTNELTKITGKVLHVHEPFITPFSKRKCVAYIIKIEQKKSTGKSSYWKTLVEQENIQDFFVKKGGEVVIVKPLKVPKNYYSYLVEDKRISSGFLNDPTPEFQKVLNYYNIDSEGFFGFNKKIKYTERIIEVGEVITVAGIAKWKSISEPIADCSYSKIAALESSDKQKLIITDHPKATDYLNTRN